MYVQAKTMCITTSLLVCHDKFFDQNVVQKLLSILTHLGLEQLSSNRFKDRLEYDPSSRVLVGWEQEEQEYKFDDTEEV